jgi:twitching motility protein PilT
MDITHILAFAMKRQASDLHLKVGLPPILRINGTLVPIKGEKRLTAEEMRELAFSIMDEKQSEYFLKSNEIDLSYGINELGRFRVNIFSQRDGIGMVLRTISMDIPTIKGLGLPNVLEKISLEPRGLVMVTGSTGSGKSTTLAAIVNHINNHRNSHILTVEDPIEFLHRDKKSIINQREVGHDTRSFASALRVGLRQDPDVILVGEMRDLETIEIALLAAETGHLVLSTLHTVDAQETVNRVIAVFPTEQQKQVRRQLSAVIRGIVSQRLVQRADGRGRVPAMEVLISTARIRECVADEEKTSEIQEAIAQGFSSYGMQSFDQSLMGLYKQGTVTYEEAMKNSSNPDDFALRISGVSGTSEGRWIELEKEMEIKTD